MYRNMKMVLMLVFFSSIVNGLPVSFDMCCGNITVVSLETFRALWKRPEKLEDIEKLNLEKNIHLEYLNASVFSGFKRLKILELWKTNLNSIQKSFSNCQFFHQVKRFAFFFCCNKKHILREHTHAQELTRLNRSSFFIL